MLCIAGPEGIYLLEFVSQKNIETQKKEICKALGDEIGPRSNKHVTAARLQLREYFRGKKQYFNLPLIFIGTPFQIKVWEQLRSVPYGKTTSYLQLAKAIGKRKGVRAVAGANARNKLAIVIPCHRVIGLNGAMVGYAGGLEKKRSLLMLERSIAGPKDLFSGKK